MQQLTKADLAKRVKEKHPEYADVDDNELADRVVKKYPAYGSMLAPDQPSQPRGMDRDFESHVNNILTSLKTRGLNARLAEGFRPPERQDALYAQGRTKPGPIVTYATSKTGKHPRGIAADIDLLDANGKPLPSSAKEWAALGEEAEKRGLVWGGGWKKIKDLRHVEARGLAKPAAQNPATPAPLVNTPAEQPAEVGPSVDLGDGSKYMPTDTGLRSRRTYSTTLTPEEEQQFQAWKQANAPSDSGDDYDLRGAFKAGVRPAANGHWPDRFKKPNHPTFSVESQYATGADAKTAGRWKGDKFIPPAPEKHVQKIAATTPPPIQLSERPQFSHAQPSGMQTPQEQQPQPEQTPPVERPKQRRTKQPQQQETSLGLTTNDLAWHFGMSADEFKNLSPHKQQSVIANLRKSVAKDEQKKKAGVQLQPSFDYINSNRKALGISAKSVVDQRGMPSTQEESGSDYDLMPFLKRVAAAPSDKPAVPLEQGLQQLRDEREVADYQREADSLPLYGRLASQELNRFAGKAERAIAGLADYAEMLPHPGRQETKPLGLSDIITGKKPQEVRSLTRAISDYLKNRSAIAEAKGNYEPEDIKASLPKTAVKAVADAGMDLAALVATTQATGIPFPVVMAGEAALNNSDKDALTIGKETAKAYALGKLYEWVPGKVAQKLKITGQVGTRAVGAGLFGGAGAAQTAYEGGDKRQILSQAIAQGAMGALGGPHEKAEREIDAVKVVRHSNPKIDGGEIVGTTPSGDLKVRNNDDGISIVKHPRKSGNREAVIVTKRAETPVQNVEDLKPRDPIDSQAEPATERRGPNRIKDADWLEMLPEERDKIRFQLETEMGAPTHDNGEPITKAETPKEVIEASETGDQSADLPRPTLTADQLLRQIQQINTGELDVEATRQLLGNKQYELKELPIGELNRTYGNASNWKSEKYSKQARETQPPIVMNDKGEVVDGKNRLAASKKRGDDTVRAWVPVESDARPSQPSQPAPVTDLVNTVLNSKVVDGPPQPPVKSETSGKESDLTSARKADLESDRSEFNLPEWSPAERKTWQQSLDNAKQKGIARDALRLSKEVSEKPRPLNDEETSGLVLKLAELKNEHKEALASGDSGRINTIEDEFNRVSNALRLSGTEKGRALAAQKLTINEDYDLITLLQRAKAKGIEITPKKRAAYEQLSNKIAETETELATAKNDVASSKAKQKATTTKKFKDRSEQRTKLDDEFDSLKKQFANEWEKTRSGNTQPIGIAGLDPEGKLTALIGKMVKNRVKAGVNDAGTLVDSIHLELKDFGINRREIAEAVSGYGQVKESDQSALAVNLREMKRQLRLALAIEDAESGVQPAKSGYQHDPQSPEVKRLRQELETAMQKSSLSPTPEQRVNESLKKEIEKLEGELKKKGLALLEHKQTQTRALDAEGTQLKAKIDSLREQLNEAREKARKQYPVQGPKDTLPAAKERLNQQIARLQNELSKSEGELVKYRERKQKPALDPEGELLRQQADSLRRELNQKKREATQKLGPKQGPSLGPKQGPVDWLPAAKKRLEKRITELERRITERDYRRAAKKEYPVTPEILKLQMRADELKTQFDTEMHNAELTTGKKWAQYAFDVAMIPKSVMSSADLSAPLRQGAFHSFSHPLISAKAFAQSLTGISNLGHEKLKQKIESHPDFNRAQASGVEFTGMDKPNAREEYYISNLTRRLPIIKHSERAFTGFLDVQRLQVFSKLSQGVKDPKALQAVADMINIASGRGNVKPGSSLAQHLYTANLALYSPRLVASRFQLLNKMFNPVAIKNMPTEVRGRLVADNVKFVAGVAAVIGLARAAGLKVGTDPDDADFLKIKAGNTRYDMLAGLQQPLRAMFRSMQALSNYARGKEDTATAGDIAGRFARSKLSPEASYLVDWFNEKTYLGKPFTHKDALASRLSPLVAKDLYDGMRQEGLIGLVKASPSFFGVGVQTYQEDIKKRIGDAREKESTESKRLTREAESLLSKDPNARSNDPRLNERIKKMREEKQKGLTDIDKQIQQLGIESGARKEFIKQELERMPPEKRDAWIKELKQKGIIPSFQLGPRKPKEAQQPRAARAAEWRF